MSTVPTLTTGTPQYTQNVGQNIFVEPLNGPVDLRAALERFPHALYTRAPDSHFIRFMYTVLGPVGLGWLKQDYLAARLALEASGAGLSDLNDFYANPFAFGRILDETSVDDVSGLLVNASWEALQVQDASYRSRALLFLKAAAQGNTPLGMRLAASSGIGQPADVYENYQYLFDQHCDIALGIPYYGSSFALGEFTVVPRVPISRSQQQTLNFDQAAVPLGTDNWTVSFKGYPTGMLSPTTTLLDLQAALQALPSIGLGNAIVTGGPCPESLTVTFTADLSNQNLPALQASFFDTYAVTIVIPVTITTGAIDPSSEVAVISDGDRYLMQQALDRLRPVASYPTYHPAPGAMQSRSWTGIQASSQYDQVIRFVTGSPAIAWPAVDNTHWIQSSTELEAPQLQNGIPAHYVGFHNISEIQAYTDQALTDPMYASNSAVLFRYMSSHAGPFPEMTNVIPFFNRFTSTADVFAPQRALADYPEPLTVTAVTPDNSPLINNIYPIDYLGLQSSPQLTYNDDQFWSSIEHATGADILEIDLGSPQAVNFITFEMTRKPIQVQIAYDALDQSPARNFVPVTPVPGYTNDFEIYVDTSLQNPWESLSYLFNDGVGMLYTRFIRLMFTRRPQGQGGFLLNDSTLVQTPYTIDVRNLRIGRNIAPSQA